MQNVAVMMKNNVEILQKLKIELPYDLAVPPLGIYSKELEAGS